jgi:LysM repeat protein/tetratricopeptide (TPR) repeat protein
MTNREKPGFLVYLLLAMALLVAGCNRFAEGAPDDDKNPMLADARAKKNAYDYEGAIESLKKALEVNPRSVSANWELGLLYYQHVTNNPAAIYHFTRVLELKPTHKDADTIRQFIDVCTKEIGSHAPPMPVSPAWQRMIDNLASSNLVLRQANSNLTITNRLMIEAWGRINATNQSLAWTYQQAVLTNRGLLLTNGLLRTNLLAWQQWSRQALTERTQLIERVRAAEAAAQALQRAPVPQAPAQPLGANPAQGPSGSPAPQSAAPQAAGPRAAYQPTNTYSSPQPAPAPVQRPGPVAAAPTQKPGPQLTPPARPDPAGPAAPVATRTHTVKKGENLTRIAQRYGLQVNDLRNANPRMDLNKIRPGQSLILPSNAR